MINRCLCKDDFDGDDPRPAWKLNAQKPFDPVKRPGHAVGSDKGSNNRMEVLVVLDEGESYVFVVCTANFDSFKQQLETKLKEANASITTGFSIQHEQLTFKRWVIMTSDSFAQIQGTVEIKIKLPAAASQPPILTSQPSYSSAPPTLPPQLTKHTRIASTLSHPSGPVRRASLDPSDEHAREIVAEGELDGELGIAVPCRLPTKAKTKAKRRASIAVNLNLGSQDSGSSQLKLVEGLKTQLKLQKSTSVLDLDSPSSRRRKSLLGMSKEQAESTRPRSSTVDVLEFNKTNSWEDGVKQATALSLELSSQVCDIARAQLLWRACSMTRTELRVIASPMSRFWTWEACFIEELSNATAVRNIVASLSSDLEVMKNVMSLTRLLCFKGRETTDIKDLPKPYQLRTQAYFLDSDFLANATKFLFPLMRSEDRTADRSAVIRDTLSSFRFLASDGPSGLIDGKGVRLAIVEAGFLELAQLACEKWAKVVALQDQAMLRDIEPEVTNLFQVLVEVSKDPETAEGCADLVDFSLTVISGSDWGGSLFAQLRELAGMVLCNVLNGEALLQFGDLIRESMHKMVSLLESKSHGRFEFINLKDILHCLNNLIMNDQNKDRVGSHAITLLFAILEEPVLGETSGGLPSAAATANEHSGDGGQKQEEEEEAEEEHAPIFAGVGDVSVKKLAAENILSLMFSNQNLEFVCRAPEHQRVLEEVRLKHDGALTHEVEGVLFMMKEWQGSTPATRKRAGSYADRPKMQKEHSGLERPRLMIS
jgi:hypothetical protein